MALETLKDVTSIGGFPVIRGKPDEMSWPEFDEHRKLSPIHITDSTNMISFKIQDGPIKEVGVNGCQVDTIISAALMIVKKLNDKFPCEENVECIGGLSAAIGALNKRKMDRSKRGVEGISKA